MAAKVKYPVRAALARFLPIYNHLNNMSQYLVDAGHDDLAVKAMDFNLALKELEKAIKPLRGK